MHIIDLELSYHYSPGRSLIPECTLYINKTQNRGKVINKLVKLQRRCNKKCLTCSTFQSASETISSAKNSTLSFSRLGLVHPVVSLQFLKSNYCGSFLCVKNHHGNCKKVRQGLTCSTFQRASETVSTLNKIVNFSRLGMMNPAATVS